MVATRGSSERVSSVLGVGQIPAEQLSQDEWCEIIETYTAKFDLKRLNGFRTQRDIAQRLRISDHFPKSMDRRAIAEGLTSRTAVYLECAFLAFPSAPAACVADGTISFEEQLGLDRKGNFHSLTFEWRYVTMRDSQHSPRFELIAFDERRLEIESIPWDQSHCGEPNLGGSVLWSLHDAQAETNSKLFEVLQQGMRTEADAAAVMKRLS